MDDMYCTKCGNKIQDSEDEFCQKCGNKINKSGEKKQTAKNNQTYKKLLIVLAIVCIVMAGVLSYAFFFNEQYQTVKISDTASLEMPVGKGLNGFYVNGSSIYEVDNGKGVVVMSYNSNKTDLASAFAFAVLKEVAVGSRFNDGELYQTTVNGSTVWSIATGNNATHDNIIISTHDKELTLKIYNSIKYNASNVKNDTKNNNTVSKEDVKQISNNTKKIVGYDRDGNPVYEGSEPWVWVDSNGYKHWSPEHQKAAEEASKENSAHSSDPSPSPTPTPTPSPEPSPSPSPG